LLILIFILNGLAQYFNWYYIFWWFDILLHFLGGYFIALLFISLCRHPIIEKYTSNWSKSFWIISTIGMVAGIGLLWEFFEWGLQFVFSISNLATISDSLSDLVFDTLGGLVFLFREYFKK
jgi:hypothetical protein